MVMHATQRGEWLVDKHFGFDFYLLQTPVNEVYATRLLQIKRCMLLAMARNTLWPNDAYKRQEVLGKYSTYGMPVEEADWHGLTLEQAQEKLVSEERLAYEQSVKPKKIEYRKELVDLLKNGYLEDIPPDVLEEEEERKQTSVKDAWKMVKKTFKGK